uniref:Uncharacterized protein n=1 Tax=viral metagenome TaxID=1070528 RepID=A0A6H1ZPT2_9ZZZZ
MAKKAKELGPVGRLSNVLDLLILLELEWNEMRKLLPLPKAELEQAPIGAQKLLGISLTRAEFWLGAPHLIEIARHSGGLKNLLFSEKEERKDDAEQVNEDD